MTFQEYLAET